MCFIQALWHPAAEPPSATQQWLAGLIGHHPHSTHTLCCKCPTTSILASNRVVLLCLSGDSGHVVLDFLHLLRRISRTSIQFNRPRAVNDTRLGGRRLDGRQRWTLISHDDLPATIQIDENGRVLGWVSEPDFRGTWDIIWTSFITVSICTFTLLCLNVPGKDDTPFVLFRRRLFWMLLAILAPEIVLTYAAGQWSRARHSLRDFHQAGYTQWTMRMAFFADMGGFVLETSDCGTFPLNAKQLHWLIVNKHVEYPETRVEEIWDKSKQDRFARLITAFQVGYTILQAIGRAVQHLSITILELNTLGIVVCSLMTAFAWLHKPADVRTPVRLGLVQSPSSTTDGSNDHTQKRPSSILEITKHQPWKTTPLDFIDENGPGWSINVQPFMKMPVIPPERPIQYIPNDRFPMNPYGCQEYLLCFATMLFTAVHVAGWNFSFPTDMETILWRVSSLVLFGVTAAFWLLETVASWVRLKRWEWIWLWLTDRGALPEYVKRRDEEMARSDAENKREPTELPLAWEFWTISLVALLYGLARVYMIVEAFLELRSVDATAFATVNWSLYFPHV